MHHNQSAIEWSRAQFVNEYCCLCAGFALHYTQAMEQRASCLDSGYRHMSSVLQCIKKIAVLARYGVCIFVDAFLVNFLIHYRFSQILF